MKNRMLFIGFLFAAGWLQAQDFDQVQIEPVQVTDNIYYLKGSGGNIGIMTGPDGVLMIDSQYEPLAAKIEAAIATLSSEPVRFLVNTHLHGDHTGANEPFARAGAVIVAQDEVYARMSTEQYNPQNDRRTPPRPEKARPVITFSRDMTFHLNGETIRVYHGPAAHTDGDVVIYFTESNVIHTGDVFVRYGFPFLDAASGGSINGFVHFVDEILDMIDDDTRVIPGHGALATKADVQAFRDNLVQLRDALMAEISKGADLDAIKTAEIAQPLEATWGGGFISAEEFVTLMYLSLKNEQ